MSVLFEWVMMYVGFCLSEGVSVSVLSVWAVISLSVYVGLCLLEGMSVSVLSVWPVMSVGLCLSEGMSVSVWAVISLSTEP